MATATKNETKKWGPTVGGQKRVAIITGGNSGLGFECAKQMLGQGYRVVLACRNPAKAKQAVQQLRAGNTSADVDSAILDVSSLRSVTAFADGWLATSSKIHVLVCNAGIMMGAKRDSADGFDLQLATNFLGHVHLINLLRERIVASSPARIIHVSSIAARFGARVNWDDPNFRKGEYASMPAYQQSKFLQCVYSKELAKRLAGTGVTSHSLEPGIVKTNLSEGITDNPGMKKRLENGISVEEGVRTHVHLATSAEVCGLTGLHWEKSRPFPFAALEKADGAKVWAFANRLLAPKLAALGGPPLSAASAAPAPTKKGVFIIACCTGNSCRSPMAEAAVRRWLQKHRPGAGDRVVSRGLEEYWVKQQSKPLPQAIQAAAEVGLDTKNHVPQLISAEEVAEAAVVFGMTRSHVRALNNILEKFDRKPEVRTLAAVDISDPYKAPLDAYRKAAKQIVGAVDKTLKAWFAKHDKRDAGCVSF